MTRALLISVRFHDGRYHGKGDWPPSPARLFQALVAAAAGPQLDDTSREALAWLEKLDAPIIAAPTALLGQPGFKLFVPNNDLDAKGGDIRRVAEIRSATKHIRPRLFDASVPLLYVWAFDEEDTHAEHLCKIAEKLYQLGRGVDMAWALSEVLDETAAEDRLAAYHGVVYRPSEKGQGMRLDCPEDGSLASLEERYKAGATRFRHNTGRTEFANAPRPRFSSMAYNSPVTQLLFDLRNTTQPGSPFAPWPLKASAALVVKLRDEAAFRLSQQSLSDHFDPDTVKKVLVGRNATEADKALRIRILPLPSIGHAHADRAIRRVLVEVPPDCPIGADDVAWAFAGLPLAGVNLETGEIESSMIELVRADEDSMLAHYGLEENRASRLWRSITPLALSTERRRIDPAKQSKLEQGGAKKGSERQSENRQAIHEVMQALRHAGMRHRVSNVRVQREPFEAKGEPAEAFSDGTRFSKHQLWHTEIEFEEPVHGPILLGNGRYCGLGLMAPVRQVNGLHAFAITDGLTDDAEPLELARAFRRAVMARVQSVLGKSEKLPLFFSGHEPDGEPARSGSHAHLAFLPDLQHKRLLVIAPHVFEHREPDPIERGRQSKVGLLEILTQALTGLTILNAGRSGKLRLAPQDVVLDADPLFAPSTQWAAPRGTYLPTRHAKKNGTDNLQSDVLRELERRNLPIPQQISLNGELVLRFMVAVQGPILLGKDFHFGGGMFVNAAPSSPPFLNP